MTDGRKYRPAHRASRTPQLARLGGRTRTTPLRRLALPTVAALALGLTGTGVLAAAPAGADDLDVRIDRAQARVERLDRVVEEREVRHSRSRDRVVATKQEARRLAARIQQQQEVYEASQLAIARGVLAGSPASTTDAGSAGTVVPVSATELSDTSERLLAGVAMVTEDTGDTSTRLVTAEETRQTLVQQRADVLATLEKRRATAQRLAAQADTAGAELGAAQGRLSELEADLEAQQAEAVSSSAVAYAMAQVGKSYVWGAAGPDAFDCSGLTMAAWATQGVSLPHSSSAQYASGTPVSESELQPGDLVFYYSPISHVGIYVGDGRIVNALNPGSGVQVSGLHDMPYSGAVRPG